MKIPFSPPFIDSDIEQEVLESLRSGWITTGPKVKELEELTSKFVEVENSICVNSWTSGALLVLKWLGVKPGDEVIIPAYTYSATALVVLHSGATPVMVDILDDFTIDPMAVKRAITSKTKAVLAVDFGGWPCDYTTLTKVVTENTLFTAESDNQRALGRIAIISDAAHSLGAKYKERSCALLADVTIYSFHAVKNVTTAEGGVICLNLPAPFNNQEVKKWMKVNSLNGQTKDAYTKTQSGDWRYDIVSMGLKINMPDICAAIGVGQMKKYASVMLPSRKKIFKFYKAYFETKSWAILPPGNDDSRESSYHLFALRLKGINESERNNIISMVAKKGISLNVHFVPLPLLTLFRLLDYNIADYPKSYKLYANEISLPIYPQLTDEQCQLIVTEIEKAYLKTISYQKIDDYQNI